MRIQNARRTGAAVLLAAGLAWLPATASADHKIYHPYVERGEAEVELRGHYDFDSNDALDGAQAHKLDIGYGMTENWFTELVLEYENPPGDSGELEALEWENIIQLTEPGRYWLDAGLYLEYAYALEDDGADELVVGGIFQKNYEGWHWAANVFAEKEIGDNRESGYGLDYGLEARFETGREGLEWGAWGFGSKGGNQQVGPMLFGEQEGFGAGELEWKFGVLFGLDSNVADSTALFSIEYVWE